MHGARASSRACRDAATHKAQNRALRSTSGAVRVQHRTASIHGRIIAGAAQSPAECPVPAPGRRASFALQDSAAQEVSPLADYLVFTCPVVAEMAAAQCRDAVSRPRSG